MKALLLVLVFSTSAFAATVKITSFYQVNGQGSKISELCGKVEGMTEKTAMVKVTADPRSKHPGIYNVIVGPEGTFCLTLTTWWGEADVAMRE